MLRSCLSIFQVLPSEWNDFPFACSAVMVPRCSVLYMDFCPLQVYTQKLLQKQPIHHVPLMLHRQISELQIWLILCVNFTKGTIWHDLLEGSQDYRPSNPFQLRIPGGRKKSSWRYWSEIGCIFGFVLAAVGWIEHIKLAYKSYHYISKPFLWLKMA